MLKTENTEINYLCSANNLVVWVMFEGLLPLAIRMMQYVADYWTRLHNAMGQFSFSFAPMNLGFNQKQWVNHLVTTLTS